MDFYPNLLWWPRVLNRDRAWQWELAARTITGGRSFSGAIPTTRFDGGGLWTAEMRDVEVSTKAQVLCWRAVAARLDAGATPFVVEARDERHAPWPLDANGAAQTDEPEAENSDGSTPSDQSVYVSDVIQAVLRDAATLRATTVTLILANASELQGGEHFSIQHDTFSHRLYRIGGVTDLGPTTGNDFYTKVLLHLNGAHGSTAVPDSSVGGGPHHWTVHGGAQISAAQPKFGTGALALDGTGDFVSTPDHADFTQGAGGFTVDLWFRCDAAGGTVQRIAGHGDNGGSAALSAWDMFRTAGNVITARVSNGSAFTSVVGTTQFTAAVNTGWHHLAFVRTGNTLRLFIDGVQEGGDVAFAATVLDCANTLTVGTNIPGGANDGTDWNGGIDEFRLSVGTARWTANFTPPDAAYDRPGNAYEVVIRPPLREATEAGTHVEFDNPCCVMKLAAPDTMHLALERRLYGSATLRLLEDFPPFEDEP